MKRYAGIMAMVAVCIVSTWSRQAQAMEELISEQDAMARIYLTKFDVNDTRLELGWKIKNDTDHDVWICASLRAGGSTVFEYFLDKDAKTLVIRRRFSLRKDIEWEFPFYRARYERLRPGEERVEAFPFSVPVRPFYIMELPHANAEYAQRLAVEIGFYDEDLAGLISNVAGVAEKLACDPTIDTRILDENDMMITDRFFGGWGVARIFRDPDIRNAVTSGADQIIIPYVGQSLNGEQVLRLVIENVSIRYESPWPPLVSQPGVTVGGDSAAQQMSPNETTTAQGHDPAEPGRS